MRKLSWILCGTLLKFIFIPNLLSSEEPFRPTQGEFPPIEKAHTYRGEVIFIDHATRRGSIRVQSGGMFRRNSPNPFAMLPYGIIRYHGAPADLRDIPLGTVMYAKGFLPPNPKISSVPVLPLNNKDKDMNHYRGVGTEPAENYLISLEDEPSYCKRKGLTWKLKEIELKNTEWLLSAVRSPEKDITTDAEPESFTLDAATRIWRGRERLSPTDLMNEGIWPKQGKQSLNNQSVLIGLNYKPTPGGIFTRFHVTDIWLDESSAQRAAQQQTEVHKAFMKGRWVPAFVNNVEYGKVGRATVTVTLFGGMDPKIYSDFKKGEKGYINASELTLKHTGAGYGPAHIASKGSIVSVEQQVEDIPFGNSGIQIKFDTDLIIEGIRKGRVVRIRPNSWPDVKLPREECIWDHAIHHEDRFPTPAIFPKYKP